MNGREERHWIDLANEIAAMISGDEDETGALPHGLPDTLEGHRLTVLARLACPD
jgi:hypothetical protein